MVHVKALLMYSSDHFKRQTLHCHLVLAVFIYSLLMQDISEAKEKFHITKALLYKLSAQVHT